MKKFYTFIILCCLCAMASAKCLVFQLTDGSKMYYELGGETNPVMHFVDGRMVVNADEYEFTDITKFYISDEEMPNAISSHNVAEPISFKANTVALKAANADAITVTTVGGTKVEAEVAAQGEYVTVNLGSLPKGVYIIGTGKTAFKVMKK